MNGDEPDDLRDEPDDLRDDDARDDDDTGDVEVVDAPDLTDEAAESAAADDAPGAQVEAEAASRVARLEDRLLNERAERHEAERLAARELRALQQTNRDLEARLAERTEELRRSLAAVTTASRATQRFLVDLGHGVSGPLSAIDALLASIDPTAVGPAERDRLADVRDHARSLSELLHGVIELAEADTAPDDTDERIPGSWLDEFVSTWTRPAVRHGQVLVPSVSGPSSAISADWRRLRRIADAVMSNVTVHAAPGGVSVDLAIDAGQVALVVTDAGPGMSDAALATALEPFVGHGAAAGAGLGLAVAHRLAVGGGGSLSLTSDDPPATTVVVALPRAR